MVEWYQAMAEMQGVPDEGASAVVQGDVISVESSLLQPTEPGAASPGQASEPEQGTKDKRVIALTEWRPLEPA